MYIYMIEFIYIYMYIPQICFQHKGFLPSLKNCLKGPSAVTLPGGNGPSAVTCRLMLFRLRPRPTWPLPGGNGPSAVTCRLMSARLFRLRALPTWPLPGGKIYAFLHCSRHSW